MDYAVKTLIKNRKGRMQVDAQKSPHVTDIFLYRLWNAF